MLAMIGDFKFEQTKKEFESMSHEITWNWSKTNRIGNHPKRQAVGKSDEVINFSGTLILQSIKSFDEFVNLADEQKPVTFSSALGSFLVVIESLKRDYSYFLKTGEYREQKFTIKLSRYYR